MSGPEADRRCNATDAYSCEHFNPSFGCRGLDSAKVWGTTGCQIKAKVYPDGKISVAHHFGLDRRNERTDPHVSPASDKYGFRVVWSGGRNAFPLYDENTPGGIPASCELHGEVLLCNTTTATTSVFADAPHSTSEIVSRLHIGAPDVEMFDEETYVMCSTSACQSLEALDGV